MSCTQFIQIFIGFHFSFVNINYCSPIYRTFDIPKIDYRIECEFKCLTIDCDCGKTQNRLSHRRCQLLCAFVLFFFFTFCFVLNIRSSIVLLLYCGKMQAVSQCISICFSGTIDSRIVWRIIFQQKNRNV